MKAALLLCATLAGLALQANTCDVKGPIDILADKVCSWKCEPGDKEKTNCPGRSCCLTCVTKIFKNEGHCDFDAVEFPPQLGLCQDAVKDTTFVDKLNELSVDKYIDKIEAMLEQIPKLKSSFCSENNALNDWMKSSEENDEPGIMEQMANSDFGKDLSDAKGSGIVAEVTGACTDVGQNMAKRNGGFCIKRFKALIDKICGKEPICEKLKSCMEQMLGYVIDYVTRRRRRRWLEDMKQRNILSRESLSAESQSLESLV